MTYDDVPVDKDLLNDVRQRLTESIPAALSQTRNEVVRTLDIAPLLSGERPEQFSTFQDKEYLADPPAGFVDGWRVVVPDTSVGQCIAALHSSGWPVTIDGDSGNLDLTGGRPGLQARMTIAPEGPGTSLQLELGPHSPAALRRTFWVVVAVLRSLTKGGIPVRSAHDQLLAGFDEYDLSSRSPESRPKDATVPRVRRGGGAHLPVQLRIRGIEPGSAFPLIKSAAAVLTPHYFEYKLGWTQKQMRKNHKPRQRGPGIVHTDKGPIPMIRFADTARRSSADDVDIAIGPNDEWYWECTAYNDEEDGGPGALLVELTGLTLTSESILFGVEYLVFMQACVAYVTARWPEATCEVTWLRC